MLRVIAPLIFHKMATPLINAQALETRAIAANKGGIMSFFRGGRQPVRALELFTRAATQYKMANYWCKAGECYEHAAMNADRSDDSIEAENLYADAARAFAHVAVDKACKLYEVVLKRLEERNELERVAKMCKEIGELLENDMNLTLAKVYYSRAGELFHVEQKQAWSNGCYIKLAEFAALEEDYNTAAEYFERVARSSLNSLSKYNVTNWLFKAGLCNLATGATIGDMKHAASTLEQFKLMYARFDSSRECKLLDDIVVEWDKKDAEAFTNIVADYDQVSKLESWTATALLIMKKQLANRSNVLVEDQNVDDDFT